jgi:hypothetical protein
MPHASVLIPVVNPFAFIFLPGNLVTAKLYAVLIAAPEARKWK